MKILSIFKRRAKYNRLELRFIGYSEADYLLKQNEGKPEDQQWHLAKEEDTNRIYGMVYIERKEKIVNQ